MLGAFFASHQVLCALGSLGFVAVVGGFGLAWDTSIQLSQIGAASKQNRSILLARALAIGTIAGYQAIALHIFVFYCSMIVKVCVALELAQPLSLYFTTCPLALGSPLAISNRK